MYQNAACLVPKCKLNWAKQEEQNGIKNTFIEADYSTTEINSQEYNLQSTSSALSKDCPSTNSDSEDDFLVLVKIVLIQMLISNFWSIIICLMEI